MPKLLLIAMAAVEVSTGVALLVAPSFVVWLLLSEGLSSPESLVLGRILGTALLSIGVACWRTRNSEPSGREDLVGSMCIYNLAVPALLVRAVFADDVQGVAIWPACLIHLVLAIGCIRCFRHS
jgi:hypothetical protein